MKTMSRFSVFIFTLALTGAASAALTTGSENVSGTRSTPAYGDANLKDNAGNPGPFGPYG